MKPRPILAGAIALLVLQILPGANNTPTLSALGKILFPDASPAASISSSSGALTVAAGGSNKDITLTPEGTGVVSLTRPGLIDIGASPATGQLTVRANSLGAIELFNAAAGNTAVNFDSRWISPDLIAAHTSVARIIKFGDKVFVQGQAGLSVGDAAGSLATQFAVDITNGRVGIMNSAPSYPLDVTGDVNASGVFRNGGTAGASATITVRNSAGTGTCTITYVGGIFTGSTC